MNTIMESFLELIVQHKNEAERKNVSNTDKTEILALIGVIIWMSCKDDTILDCHDLW